MTPASKLLRVFAVCAGVAAYVSLDKYVAGTKDVSRFPHMQMQETESDDKGFGNPLTAFFSRMFTSRFCIPLPDESDPYNLRLLSLDCSKRMHRTDSGDFLIRHFLQKEYEEKTGVFQRPSPRPDPEPFRFVG